MSRRLWIVAALVLGVFLLGSPASAQPSGGCAVPPEPDRPGSGLVGMLDPTPPGVGAPDSVYGEVGYGGMTWRTYDLCARPDIATTAGTDTWFGGQLFNVAKVTVAAANGLHYQLVDGGQLDGLDALLHDGVAAMYRAAFTTWLGPALLVLAVILLVLAAKGDLAQQTQRAGIALGALVLGSAVYAAPVSLLQAGDVVVLDGIAEMQSGFLDELGAGDRDSLPAVLTDQIIYRNWLAGQFGSADAPQAVELGRDLLRAQTFTRAELEAGQDTAETAAVKKQQFQDLTTRMGDRYAQFQGASGSRVGAGGIAVVQAAALAAFPAAAKLIMFIALIVLRMLVLFAPLIAVIAILRPQILTNLFRIAAGVAVNAVLAAALAAVHAWLVVAMLRPDSAVSPLVALIVAAVVSVLFWVLIRPVRRVLTIGSMVMPSRAITYPPPPSLEQGTPAGAWRPAQPAVPADRWLPPALPAPRRALPVPPTSMTALPAAPRRTPTADPDRSQRDDLETTTPNLLTDPDRPVPMAAAVPGARPNGHHLGSGRPAGRDLGDW